jgi:tRNA dimethylallyltransferase
LKFDPSKSVLMIAGPTASGKSALAESLIADLEVELISVDSALVYQGMDIGSAKPDKITQQRCRYHLLDLLAPEQSYSAAEFVNDATRLIAEIHARGRLPVLVGGTMLYYRALIQGLSDLPASDALTRQQLLNELAERGLPAMHAELAKLDPIAAQRIHANDPQRTMRALEVFRMTGQPMSSLQTVWKEKRKEPNYQRHCFALMPDRAWLHARIAIRFQQMLDAGFLSEVRTLMGRPQLSIDHTSMRAVGYRQAWEHLRGDYDLAALIERGVAATRQLAKRQYTWLRGDPIWQVLDQQLSKQREIILQTCR